ncbi:hypothetical protein NPIL_438071 [Nephila pilipes]|uniref:Uncharacterized protein n=1 Tax=Nephila pilipes TaxID=299642 RepID=A0A8X6U1J7_NEPPI|nr:hypothetical protein NPIL_438071 [Nephila pilipes]
MSSFFGWKDGHCYINNIDNCLSQSPFGLLRGSTEITSFSPSIHWDVQAFGVQTFTRSTMGSNPQTRLLGSNLIAAVSAILENLRFSTYSTV